VPPSLAFDIRGREQLMLFENLPLLSADMSTFLDVDAMRNVAVEEMAAHHENELVAGMAQANAVTKVVDLWNASAAGIAYKNRRRVTWFRSAVPTARFPAAHKTSL
jgi:small subunit ribosomal protein S15